VSVPPSGGPEDKTPPRVDVTVPARDSAGVAVDSDIRITFSEKMATARAERLVTFAPEVEVGDARWDGTTLVLTTRAGLARDTTYVVTLKSGFQDRHGVAAKDDYRFAFATAAHIDSGTVSGTVRFRREPTRNGVVLCYTLPVDSGFAPGGTRPNRRTGADADGRFRLEYLPTNDRAVVVWAFEDRNRNQVFEPADEVGLEVPETVVLSPGTSAVGGVDLAIVDPDEPAVVRGRVVNSSGLDTLAVSVALYADTASTPRYYTACDTSGAYEFRSVSAGDYELRAFVDVVADSVCGAYPCGLDSARTCEEPCAIHPDRVVVAPGDTRVVSPIELAPARREENER
jgi:hypothetical protein